MKNLPRRGARAGTILFLLVFGAVSSCEPKPAEKPAPTPADGQTTAPATGGDITAEPTVTGPPDHAPAGRTAPAKITLVYSTAVSGEVWDCGCPGHPRGGVAPRCQWVQGLRDSGAEVVYLDAGDGFFRLAPGTPPSEPERKQAGVLAKALIRLKAAAVNVGPMDLRAGLSYLRADLKTAGGDSELPLISANLAGKDGALIFPASTTVSAGDVTVSIFGLISAEPIPGDSVSALDPAKAAADMVAKLRSGCDLLVGLYAMEFAEASRLAKEVPGVDVIIVSSRGSTVKTQPMVVGESLLCQAGNRGMYVGRMEVEFKAGGGADLPREEHAAIKEQLTRLEAQRTILEGQALNDPAMRIEYDKVVAAQGELRKKLATAGDWNYDHSVVSIEKDMPPDQTVLDWINQAGIPPKPEKGH